jgi:putative transposase
MSRPNRYQSLGAAYHIVSHTVGNQVAFREESDFRHFKKGLAEMIDESGTELFGYGLIPNHLHLEGRTPENIKALSVAMKRLLRNYTLYRQEKYDSVGSLWRPRFWSCGH